MATMTSFYAESAATWWVNGEASAACLCSSDRQFLIYSTFVLVVVFGGQSVMECSGSSSVTLAFR